MLTNGIIAWSAGNFLSSPVEGRYPPFMVDCKYPFGNTLEDMRSYYCLFHHSCRYPLKAIICSLHHRRLPVCWNGYFVKSRKHATKHKERNKSSCYCNKGTIFKQRSTTTPRRLPQSSNNASLRYPHALHHCNSVTTYPAENSDRQSTQRGTVNDGPGQDFKRIRGGKRMQIRIIGQEFNDKVAEGARIKAR